MATISLYTETRFIKCGLEKASGYIYSITNWFPYVSPKRATVYRNLQLSPLMFVQLLFQNQGFLTTVMIQELMHIDYIQQDRLRTIDGASD